LGAGPAGLSAGYYAKRNGMPFTVYEATDRIGGNCVTFEHDGFLFDSGAHRLHDKDAEVTKELKNLLGDDLRLVDVPSQIYWNGTFVYFPLLPIDLMKRLGACLFLKAVADVLCSRFRNKNTCASFADFALRCYGKTIAER